MNCFAALKVSNFPTVHHNINSIKKNKINYSILSFLSCFFFLLKKKKKLINKTQSLLIHIKYSSGKIKCIPFMSFEAFIIKHEAFDFVDSKHHNNATEFSCHISGN